MSYIKAGGSGGSNYSLPIANATTLGGVKIGSGITVGLDGTISVPQQNNNGSYVQVTDAYLISGKVMGMGFAEANVRSGMTLVISANTVLEIAFSNGTIKRFSIPQSSININVDYTLRINIATGEIKILDAITPFINEILLIRVNQDIDGTMVNQGAGALVVTGGYFIKYFYPNGVESEQILTPKNVTRTDLGSGGFQSINFINNELWCFDKEANTSSITIRNPSTLAVVKTMSQAGYHFNTTDYNPNNDKLLTVYGWDNPPGPTSFRILHDVSTWKNKPSGSPVVDAADSSQYDEIVLTGLGEGPQAMWGERNNGQDNIVYVVTDANVRIRQLLLGKGTNNLGSGTFVTGKTSDKYNGTYKIIGDWTQIHGSGRIQDGFFYNGCVYAAMDSGADSWGQLGVIVHKFELMSDGRIRKVKIHSPVYDTNGNVSAAFSGGCTLYNGKIWMISGSVVNTFDLV